jgi:hypothetical protein
LEDCGLFVLLLPGLGVLLYYWASIGPIIADRSRPGGRSHNKKADPTTALLNSGGIVLPGAHLDTAAIV